MALREIIEIGNHLMRNREAQAQNFDYKSFEHDCLMADVYDIGAIILKIESCLHVFGFESKIDYREDTAFYLRELETWSGNDDKIYEIFRYFGKSVDNVVLWAKKLSWLGDWDLNFDGRRTHLTIEFVPAPEITQYNVPRHYFHKGENIEAANYKLKIKSSEANLSDPVWLSFSENWEEIEFSLHEYKESLLFRGKAFTWDKSKFAGSVYQRPFYAARTTEYFGKNYIVYYSAKY
jgi:hypothetical protein